LNFISPVILGILNPADFAHPFICTAGGALNTGMRKGEIMSLRWNQIRNGFIYLEKTKTKNRREISVNEDLAAISKHIRKEEGLTSE
jgi:integrase